MTVMILAVLLIKKKKETNKFLSQYESACSPYQKRKKNESEENENILKMKYILVFSFLLNLSRDKKLEKEKISK
jgi:NADH:ubiquinone oxidoreductase subunit 3 (subunit A)